MNLENVFEQFMSRAPREIVSEFRKLGELDETTLEDAILCLGNGQVAVEHKREKKDIFTKSTIQKETMFAVLTQPKGI